MASVTIESRRFAAWHRGLGVAPWHTPRAPRLFRRTASSRPAVRERWQGRASRYRSDGSSL